MVPAFKLCVFMLFTVCQRWYRLCRKLWKMRKQLTLENTFTKLGGKGGDKLNDKHLLSVLERGCGELQVLDISAATHCLSSYALDIVG